MIRGLYTAVSAMITQEQKQNVVTNNIANASTNGFKKDNLAYKSFGNYMVSNYDMKVGTKNVKNELGTISLGSKIDEVDTDFAEGNIQETSKTTDFAIEGEGFFVVQRNNGVESKNYYTRDGHFHVNGSGILVTDSGDKVLGRNLNTNSLEPIYVGNDKFVSDLSGNICVEGSSTPTYKLHMVDFKGNDNNGSNKYKGLEKAGNNLYTVSQNSNLTEDNNVNVTVRQNFIEKSNVNLISEMVEMMTTMRVFETNQKMIQTIDETLGKAANEVGSIR